MKAPVKAALAALVVVGVSVVSMSLLAPGRKEVLDAATAPRVVPSEVPAERTSSPPPKVRSTAPAKELLAREKASVLAETPRPGATAAPLPPASLTVTAVDDSTAPIEGIPVILAGERGLVSSVTRANGEASFEKIQEGPWELRLQPAETAELASPEKLYIQAGEEQSVTVRIGIYELSISGQVLDRGGQPIAGIPVEASRIAGPEDDGLLPVRARREPAVTLDDGSYEITELESGEYALRTVPTDRYASTSRVTRAGSDGVNLVLDEGRSVTVRGRVSDTNGRSLAGAEVLSVPTPLRRVATDPDGSYALEVLLGSREKSHSLRFRLDGYRQTDLEIRDDGSESDEIVLDASLEPLGPAGSVSGVVLSRDGVLLEGQELYLESPGLHVRSKAVSDADGRFSFEEAPPGDDYRLWVRPRKDFEDFSLDSVLLGSGGLEVEVVLEPLEEARLEGQVVNAMGVPVPDVSFWITSVSARGRSIELKVDSDGRFELPDCPAGKLLLDTRSSPRFTVRGLEVTAGSERAIRIVVDSGEHEVTGTVTDSSGRPLEGAPVEISWSRSDDGIRVTSQRKTLTDGEGRFRFEGLGGGRHTIKASAANHRIAQLDHDVGGSAPVPVIRLAAGEGPSIQARQ